MTSITITDHLTSWFNVSNIRKYLEELKSRANPLKSNIPNIKSIVVPHAGVVYSGLAMMSTYLSSYRKNITRIILLSTDHDSLEGANFINANSITTKNDSESFKIHLENVKGNYTDINNEHALLNQIPFIDFLYGNQVKVIPVIVGKITLEQSKEIATKLKPYLGPNTLIVCSTDFNHVNGRFQHKIFAPNIQSKITNADSLVVKLLTDNKDSDFIKNIRTNNLSPCGIYALQLLKSIHLAENYKRCNVSCYYKSSNEFKSSKLFKELFKKIKLTTEQTSVSYVGLLFTNDQYLSNSDRPLLHLLTPFEKKVLTYYANSLLYKSKTPFYCPVFYRVKLGVFIVIKTDNNEIVGRKGTLNHNKAILDSVKEHTLYFVKDKTHMKHHKISIFLFNKMKSISYNDYKPTSSIEFKSHTDILVIKRKNNETISMFPEPKPNKPADKLISEVCSHKQSCVTLFFNEGIELKSIPIIQ